MSLAPDLTVGELAAARPAAMRVLDRAGIDYCCGGKRTIGDACAKAGLPLAELETRIDAAEATPVSPPDWRQEPLVDLLDHIEAVHHAFTRTELDRTASLAAHVARAHGEHQPALVEIHQVVGELRAELLEHLIKEERVLFPRIRALTSGAGLAAAAMLSAPIERMEYEHERASAMLNRLRELADGYVVAAGACGRQRALFDSLAALEADLHVHMHLESNVLFPRVLEAAR